MQAALSTKDAMISFAEKLANSDKFEGLFRDGMELLEQATAYLDGDGREAAKALDAQAAAVYAAESMRLTSRMMQLVSWLLLQRAVNRGEISRADALVEKRKLRFSRPALVSDEAMLARLPLPLVKFIETSLRVQARVVSFDQLLYRVSELHGPSGHSNSPVASQMALLKAAFSLSRLDGVSV